MDKQEVFNKIWNHFIVEKNPRSVQSVDADSPTEICLYRGPNGSKCAFGVLIPDEDYSEKMEGNGCHSPIFTRNYEKWGLVENDWLFYIDLQAVHDRAVRGARAEGMDVFDFMKVKFELLAIAHNLTIPG
jgi:hypothetical protein